MAEKKKYETFTTPNEGTLIHTYLNNPRDYKNDEKFRYQTGYVLYGDAAAEFEKFVDEQMELSAQEGKCKVGDAPYGPYVIKDDEGNKTEVEGATHFKFSVQAKTVIKNGARAGEVWDRRPEFFDAAGTPIVDPPMVGAGTKALINFQVYRWGKGVTLQPTAVQIIDLVEFKGGAGKGFAAREGGGYVAPAPSPEDVADGRTDDDPEAGDDF